MKPRESEHLGAPVHSRKIQVKGHRPQAPELGRQSEENLLRHGHKSDEEDNRAEELASREQRLKPKMNNLIGLHQNKPEGSNMESLGNLNDDEHNRDIPTPALRSGELPPVKTGKVPIRRAFKPADVQQQDFDGM